MYVNELQFKKVYSSRRVVSLLSSSSIEPSNISLRFIAAFLPKLDRSQTRSAKKTLIFNQTFKQLARSIEIRRQNRISRLLAAHCSVCKQTRLKLAYMYSKITIISSYLSPAALYCTDNSRSDVLHFLL